MGRHSSLARACRDALKFMTQHEVRYTTATDQMQKPTAWVFLGPPGVGKGTYSTRIADAFGLSYIASGDLIRREIKEGTPLGKEMNSIVVKGHLLPDNLILQVIREHVQDSFGKGNGCFLLDGFPRSVPQAEALESFANVELALDLDLREEVLLEKCLGRRICSRCGKNYNIADIKLPGSDGKSEIIMPPLPPPPECEPYMEQRHDDTKEVIQRRLQIYKDSAEPVKEFYRQRGILINFEITGGIPETFPRLKALLEPYKQMKGTV